MKGQRSQLTDQAYSLYIHQEPNGEFGFGMYEAVRDVFGVKPEGGWPTNYVPADIGRGPYPVEDDDGGPVHPFNGLRWR